MSIIVQYCDCLRKEKVGDGVGGDAVEGQNIAVLLVPSLINVVYNGKGGSFQCFDLFVVCWMLFFSFVHL